jgi:hypothetical protein
MSRRILSVGTTHGNRGPIMCIEDDPEIGTISVLRFETGLRIFQCYVPRWPVPEPVGPAPRDQSGFPLL